MWHGEEEGQPLLVGGKSGPNYFNSFLIQFIFRVILGAPGYEFGHKGALRGGVQGRVTAVPCHMTS